VFATSFTCALIGAGCASPERGADQIANRGGLQSLVIAGQGFQHRAYARVRGSSGMLVLFVDSDGTPWEASGTRVSADPTPTVPLALKLAIETPDSVLYLGRPCYFGAGPKTSCPPSMWTARRYSEDAVNSMVTATTTFAEAHGFSRVLLVGYSGGGTVAVLMAPRLHSAAGVITIAANLDTDAWTQWHRYAPLSGSLNPYLQPALPRSVPEWHLLAERDVNVPYATVERYLERVPAGHIRRYPAFDHACCWEKVWPSVLSQVIAELGGS
jgi:pimeloyl-ACP methyl ester carboxylesterase